MVERQQETALVGSPHAREDVGVNDTAARGDRPVLTALDVDGADRSAQILVVELSTQRRVLAERRRDVLVIRERIESAVVRTGDRVVDRFGPLVNEELVIRERRRVPFA